MPIFSFLHSQWKVCVRLSSFRLHLRFPSASATFTSTGWTCPCSESECSFSTQFQSCPATAERRSHVRHGDTFKKVLTCPADTHLEEMLKGYSFVEFIRLLWGGGECYIGSHREPTSEWLHQVPCDPLKCWPPPTWRRQRCFWQSPSPGPRCETAALPPPAQKSFPHSPARVDNYCLLSSIFVFHLSRCTEGFVCDYMYIYWQQNSKEHCRERSA